MPATLQDVPLDQLLTHLAQHRATGTLTVEVPAARKKLYLVDGWLAGVTSTNPRELLGHFLVGWGLVGEEQLAEAMRLQELLGTPLGRILQRMGAIDSESLEQALAAQSEEAVLDLFIAPAIHQLHWAENILPLDRPLELRRPLPPLVVEGQRRRKTIHQLHAVLGRKPVILERLQNLLPPSLPPRDQVILAAVDGQRTLEEVAFVCRLPTFFVAEVAARGVREGFLRLRPVPEPALEPSLSFVVQRALAALAQGDLLTTWKAVQLLRGPLSGYRPPPETAALASAVLERVGTVRSNAFLIPHRVVPPPPLPAGASTELAFVLSRVNGRWSLRQIQRITPLEEAHFWALVDTLVRAGIIQLRPPTEGMSLSSA